MSQNREKSPRRSPLELGAWLPKDQLMNALRFVADLETSMQHPTLSIVSATGDVEPFDFGEQRAAIYAQGISDYLLHQEGVLPQSLGKGYLLEAVGLYALKLFLATQDNKNLMAVPASSEIDASHSDASDYQKGGDCVVGGFVETRTGNDVHTLLQPDFVVDMSLARAGEPIIEAKVSKLGYNKKLGVPVFVMPWGGFPSPRLMQDMKTAILQGDYPYFAGFPNTDLKVLLEFVFGNLEHYAALCLDTLEATVLSQDMPTSDQRYEIAKIEALRGIFRMNEPTLQQMVATHNEWKKRR